MNDVTLGMVLEARERLRKVVRHTDLVHARTLGSNNLSVYLKAECLQHTGSFKVRGAYNMISHMTGEERARGVIASSAGNHAQGVALAAAAFGVKSTIVMPEGAPLAKIAATRELGSEVVLNGLVYDDAYQYALQIQEQAGSIFVHPFDDPLVIAGQGSVGLEIMDDAPEIDAVIVPVGGGGLISGIALAIKQLHPHVRVIGVESVGAASMKASFEAGHPVTLSSAHTIADGIAVKSPGELTYAIAGQYVDEIVTVEEDEIANAILVLLEKCKIVAEGAGAVSVAALINEKVRVKGKVCCVISGGNIDVTTLQRILDKGLMKAGRLAQVHTMIEDRPGRLHRLLAVVSDSGANVVSIRHDRTNMESGIGMARLELTLETHHRQHLDSVMERMEENGYGILDEEYAPRR